MAIELFDFVKVLFTDPKKYSELKNSEKSRHFFMTQRFMAIKHPTTAQSLNRTGMNPWAVLDLWHIVAYRYGQKLKRVPGWIYTKTKKTTSTEKTWKPDSEVAELWMKKNGLTEKDLKDAIKFNPEEMKRLFSALEKQIKMYER
jgi:hypothetical protein